VRARRCGGNGDRRDVHARRTLATATFAFHPGAITNVDTVLQCLLAHDARHYIAGLQNPHIEHRAALHETLGCAIQEIAEGLLKAPQRIDYRIIHRQGFFDFILE
jgi:hypothetical protein